MKDRSKESNSWPVIIVCVIVGFIFFGNYIFDYFGIRWGDEEIVEKVGNQPASVTSNIVEKSLNKNVDKVVDLTDDKSQNESSDKLDETKTDTNGDTVTDVERINVPSPKIGFIRVEKDGSGIISGTGKAGSSVSVLLNDKPVADGIIGGDGQFALFFDLPELDQPYRLKLKQTQSNGDSTESLESALISPSVKKDLLISSNEGAVASADEDTVVSLSLIHI